MTHTHTTGEWEVLRADRSECNESIGRFMAGCLANGEKVIAYFPTDSSMANARLIAAAPDLLAALGAIAKQAEFSALAFPNAPGRGDLLAIAQMAGDAIAKATGKVDA